MKKRTRDTKRSSKNRHLSLFPFLRETQRERERERERDREREREGKEQERRTTKKDSEEGKTAVEVRQGTLGEEGRA